MDYRVLQGREMLLVGMACEVTLGDVENRATICLSEQFMARKNEILNGTKATTVYGLSTDPENYNPESDKFEYFIGVEVSESGIVPEGMVARIVPGHEHVVFTFNGPSENAGKVHYYLYSTWLPTSQYELADLYNYEVYDERSKGPDAEDSITDIYFPIRKKAE